jgi:hypothetical protein
MQHAILDPDVLRLCYVDGRDQFAWFTSCPLAFQWGDDWDDKPYEHNAGDPYTDHEIGGERVKHQLVKVAWESNYVTPCSGHVNSPYSVRDINCGGIAWLRAPSVRSDSTIAGIYAGASLREFIKAVESSGGEVYFPRTSNIYV